MQSSVITQAGLAFRVYCNKKLNKNLDLYKIVFTWTHIYTHALHAHNITYIHTYSTTIVGIIPVVAVAS